MKIKLYSWLSRSVWYIYIYIRIHEKELKSIEYQDYFLILLLPCFHGCIKNEANALSRRMCFSLIVRRCADNDTQQHKLEPIKRTQVCFHLAATLLNSLLNYISFIAKQKGILTQVLGLPWFFAIYVAVTIDEFDIIAWWGISSLPAITGLSHLCIMMKFNFNYFYNYYVVSDLTSIVTQYQANNMI